MLPAAAIGKKEVAAELWYVGGERAYSAIEQPLDVGEGMANEAVQEWTRVGFEGASAWHTKGGAYSLARGGDVHVLEECCAAAAVTDSGARAAQLGRVGMELVWVLERVFTREVWNKCGSSEEKENMYVEGPSVMVVRGNSRTQREGRTSSQQV